MKTSIIVPTYNRAGLLRRTLASLTRQTGADGQFEVIVADDGSSDNTISVVESFARDLPLRYVREEDEGFRVAAARNAGPDWHAMRCFCSWTPGSSAPTWFAAMSRVIVRLSTRDVRWR